MSREQAITRAAFRDWQSFRTAKANEEAKRGGDGLRGADKVPADGELEVPLAGPEGVRALRIQKAPGDVAERVALESMGKPGRRLVAEEAVVEIPGVDPFVRMIGAGVVEDGNPAIGRAGAAPDLGEVVGQLDDFPFREVAGDPVAPDAPETASHGQGVVQ